MISIGFDIGGTNTKIAVIDDKYSILKNIKIKTPLHKGYEYFIKELSDIAKAITNEFSDRKYLTVSIGVAGDVDFERGILRYAPNLNGWKNKNIKKDFEKKSKLRCIVENDANMASWGVYVFDVKKNAKNIVVFTLGTGIGGGVIIDGKLYRGFTSTAGEIGHMIIKENGERCKCGNLGCLEAYCGSYAILREARKKIKNIKSYCSKYQSESNMLTPRVIFNAALKGDSISKEIWENYGCHLGTGVGNICVLLNPEVVVFTGGISKAYSFFMPAVKRRLNEYGIKTPVKKIKIKISTNKDMGVLGCASFGLENK